MTLLSIGTLWLSVNLTPGVLSQSGVKVLSIPVLNDKKGQGLGSFLHAVKVDILNASNQRQSMYCRKLKLTEVSFSRNAQI